MSTVKARKRLPRTGFQRWLSMHGACKSGRRHAGNRTPQQVWQTLNKSAYMVWLIRKLAIEGYLSPAGVDALTHITWKCDCATVRKLLPTLPEFRNGRFISWSDSQRDRLLSHWLEND